MAKRLGREMLMVATLMACPQLVAAQETDAAPEVAEPPVPVPAPVDPRVKIGIGAGAEWALGGGGGDTAFLFSVPMNEKYAFEIFAGKFHGHDEVNTDSVYGFQVRRALDDGRTPQVTPFLTFGGMGIVARPDHKSCGVPGGGGCVTTHPRQVYPPIVFLAGVGAEFNVSPRVIIRTELDGGIFFIFPVSLRAAASVVIPLGRGSSSPLKTASR